MIATYRLQLGPHLDLHGARRLVPYLTELGVSHLYLSPVWQARRGSTHGYDVVDPRRVSDELGGEGALRRLADEGLELILDIVPNHMAASDENPFWADEGLREKFFDLDPVTGRHRRFFDIDELAGVRMEDPEVFAVCHSKLRELIDDGIVAGLRVDHPDGLSDPTDYLRRAAELGVPLWVEKITEPGETLPDWPVAGTTGYDFLNEAMGVFVVPEAETTFGALHEEMTGQASPFHDVAARAKLQQAHGTFTPELERMRRLAPIDGLAAAVAELPVYRTYVVPERGELSDADRTIVEAASFPDRLRRALLLETDGDEELVRRFQQTTGAVMAKGVEDTAFYRYTRFVALNEVGGDPGRFGWSVEDFHAASTLRAKRFPRAMLATTTHDTKRSADVRARLVALTHHAERWAEVVRGWRRAHAALREGQAPGGGEEYLLYQTLVGAWPISKERLDEYLTKALREAKIHTAWVDGDPDWEAAVLGFAHRVVGRPGFATEIERLLEEMEGSIELVTLGQVALKLTAPGVPDIYQGDEDEMLALVDPDNRRPVDWARLEERLSGATARSPNTLGLAKLALHRAALDLRRRRPASHGRYEPLPTTEALVAFARGGEVLVVVATRQRSGHVELAEHLHGQWRNVLTGSIVALAGTVPASMLLADVPLAILERVADDRR